MAGNRAGIIRLFKPTLGKKYLYLLKSIDINRTLNRESTCFFKKRSFISLNDLRHGNFTDRVLVLETVLKLVVGNLNDEKHYL